MRTSLFPALQVCSARQSQGCSRPWPALLRQALTTAIIIHSSHASHCQLAAAASLSSARQALQCRVSTLFCQSALFSCCLLAQVRHFCLAACVVAAHGAVLLLELDAAWCVSGVLQHGSWLSHLSRWHRPTFQEPLQSCPASSLIPSRSRQPVGACGALPVVSTVLLLQFTVQDWAVSDALAGAVADNSILLGLGWWCVVLSQCRCWQCSCVMCGSHSH